MGNEFYDSWFIAQALAAREAVASRNLDGETIVIEGSEVLPDDDLADEA